MTLPSTGHPEFRAVGVFRALQLGDLICAIPAIRALKRSHPANRISLIGLPWAEELVTRFPAYLDDFIPFPGWPGIGEREPDRSRAHEYEFQAAHRRFVLAVQMHGDGRASNGFVVATPAEAHAGFAPDEGSSVPGFLPYPRDRSEVERLLMLAEHLGATDLDARLEFPVSEAEHADATRALHAAGLPSGAPYVVVHAGGRGPDRRWSAEGFAAVADTLATAGHAIVLTGSEVDRSVNEKVRAQAEAPIVDLTGRTSIGTLAATVGGASLVVTNDSAPSHLAAALRVPSVVIFTGSDRARWAPSDRGLHRAVGDGRPDGGVATPPPTVREVLAAVPAMVA